MGKLEGNGTGLAGIQGRIINRFFIREKSFKSSNSKNFKELRVHITII